MPSKKMFCFCRVSWFLPANLNGGVRHDPGDTDVFGSNMRAQNWAIKNPPNSSFLISEYPILRLKQIELFGMVPSTHKRAPGQILPSSQRPRTGLKTVGGSPFGWRLVDENPTNQGVFWGNQQIIRDLRYSVIGILIGIVVDIYIPSGKHTKNYGKSPCYSWEMTTISMVDLSIVMLNDQRVYI